MKTSKKNIVKVLKTLLLLCILMLMVPKSVHASENPFSVSPIDPNTNQPQGNYYDLMVTPESTQTLKVRIYNPGNKEIRVHIGLNNGGTNDNGITSYLGNTKPDSTLKVPFSNLASTPNKEVVIEKEETKDIPILLTIPKTPFKGEILGGIRVTMDQEGKESSSKSKSKAAVESNIAYTIGVVLKEDETHVQPKINLLSVQTEQRNMRNVISATLQNSSPRIIKTLTTDAKVYKKGGSKLYYSSSNNDMRMAPNSHFNYGITLQDEAFEAGNYTLKIQGKADGTPYHFEKDFTITRSEAKKWNDSAVYIKTPDKDNTMLYVIILVLAILIVSLIILILFIHNKQKTEKDGPL